MTGDGDLDAAAAQVRRFLSPDVDARDWPDVAGRDPVITDAQTRLPGLRPCGFHSPYEAAAWSVLSQRIRIVQAARLRDDVVARHGDAGAFPAPQVLRALDLDLPGRKAEYLQAVAEAALDGALDSAALRSVDPGRAVEAVQQVKGLRPFAAELVVLRGANAPDAYPGTSAASTPRSPTATVPTAPSPRCRPSGAPTGPGPPSICALSVNNAPRRSTAGSSGRRTTRRTGPHRRISCVTPFRPCLVPLEVGLRTLGSYGAPRPGLPCHGYGPDVTRRSPGWWLQFLGVAHAGVGVVLYHDALAEIASAGIINSVPDRGDRATAFWFMASAPTLWLGGRLLRSAEAAGDLAGQRAAGVVLTAAGLVGTAVMPVSGFPAVAAVGSAAVRRSVDRR